MIHSFRRHGARPAARSTGDTKMRKNGTGLSSHRAALRQTHPLAPSSCAPTSHEAARHRLQLAFGRNLWDEQGALLAEGKGNPGGRWRAVRRKPSGWKAAGRTGVGRG